MTKDDPKNGWWDPEPEVLDFSAASLPEEFKVKNPWDIISNYPEAAWKAFKTLHDNCLNVEAERDNLVTVNKELHTSVDRLLSVGVQLESDVDRLQDQVVELKQEIERLRSAARMTEVIKHCGENKG